MNKSSSPNADLCQTLLIVRSLYLFLSLPSCSLSGDWFSHFCNCFCNPVAFNETMSTDCWKSFIMCSILPGCFWLMLSKLSRKKFPFCTAHADSSSLKLCGWDCSSELRTYVLHVEGPQFNPWHIEVGLGKTLDCCNPPMTDSTELHGPMIWLGTQLLPKLILYI